MSILKIILIIIVLGGISNKIDELEKRIDDLEKEKIILKKELQNK